MIAVDDLKPLLGCYGHDQMHTPNIDALAAAGTRFDRAYCQVAVCGASRASLLTGLRPTRERFLHYYTRADKDAPGTRTLPAHFKDHGYTCRSLGKIFHHRSDYAGHWSAPPSGVRGSYPGYVNHPNDPRRSPATEAADVPDEAYPDGRLATRALRALDELRGGPFFLGVGFFKPHLAFACPRRYWDMYDPTDIDPVEVERIRGNVPGPALHNWGELRTYGDIPQRGDLTDAQARRLIHGYYACVSYIDAMVGRVLDHLERTGLADSTVVALWGDHGYHLGDHGLWCKHSNFEHATRVPLIVRGPGVPERQHTAGLSEFVDLYPSLSDLCGLDPPDHLQGSSFVPLLNDTDRPWKSAAFSQYMRKDKYLGRSMRTDRYRLSRWDQADGTFIGDELYDHRVDPKEMNNLANRPEHQALRQRLADRLQAGWRAARPERG
jgi:arylsulfatase A-like enzyme